MTEVMKPFDPFQMMMERPVPRKINEKKREVDENENKIIIPILITISLESKKEIDREEILERLRKTKNWITRCDVPLKYTEDSDYEFDVDILEEDNEKEELEEEELEEEEKEELEKEELEEEELEKEEKEELEEKELEEKELEEEETKEEKEIKPIEKKRRRKNTKNKKRKRNKNKRKPRFF